MVNGTTQAIETRNSAGIAISNFRVQVRGRQEPAATPTEVERGSTVLSSTKVRNALAKTWGWA